MPDERDQLTDGIAGQPSQEDLLAAYKRDSESRARGRLGDLAVKLAAKTGLTEQQLADLVWPFIKPLVEELVEKKIIEERMREIEIPGNLTDSPF